MKQNRQFCGKFGLQISYVLMLTLIIPLISVRIWQVGLQYENELLNETNAPLFGWDIPLLVVYFVVILILGILNIIQSFQSCHKKEIEDCINRMLILKYGMVVFFVINFAVVTLMMIAGGLLSLIASRGTIIFALPIMLPGLVLFILPLVIGTWSLLLPSAFYGVQVIRLSYSEKKFGFKAALLHVLFQFNFLIDVLDAMYLSVKKWGMGKKSAVLIGILYAIAALAAIWVVVKICALF